MIKRLIAIALVVCGVPFAVHAQPQTTKVYRVGFLGTASASGYVREIEWIRAGAVGPVCGRSRSRRASAA